MASRRPVVIVGGGPAGAVCAARLAQLGTPALVLEKLAFPRFRLGESLLPKTLDTLATIGVLDAVAARFLEKRGAQFVDDCGESTARFDFTTAFDATYAYSFQVPRDEFDALLLDHAAALGAEVRHGWEVTRLLFDDGRCVGVEATGPDGAASRIDAAFVVDASGRDALGARAAGAVERLAGLENTAFFTHYQGIPREPGEREGDVRIIMTKSGWLWSIPFKDGRTSVGLVATREWMGTRRAGETPDDLFERGVAGSPSAAQLVEGARKMWPARATADFSYGVRRAGGPGWLAIGDAGGFIDPLFSTGVHIAVTGATMVAARLAEELAAGGDVRPDAFDDVSAALGRGTTLFVTAVRAFYGGKLQPYLFAADKRAYLRRAITSLLAGDVFGDARWMRDIGARLDEMTRG